MAEKALADLRVLELASLIATPFAGALMAELGAEVIKVEHPTRGDFLRAHAPLVDGHSLYWAVTARNKKCITCDMSTPKGQEIIRQLVAVSDVVLENFRPGMLEAWRLGWEDLQAINPRLVMLRLTGYGQTGPYRDRPGFGAAAEAMSGATYLTGYPDHPPVRPCYPLGDYVTGLFSAFAVVAALRYRDRSGKGQWIDAALYETMFRILEFLYVEYDKTGNVRERTGNLFPGIAPADAFQAKDGRWLTFRAITDAMFARLCVAIGREEMAGDPRYASLAQRWEHRDELHATIRAWTAERTAEEVTAVLAEAGVSAVPTYSAEDIAADPHYRARQMIIEVQDELLGALRMPAPVPRLSLTPGTVEWPGPQRLGAHNEEVYGGLLGYSPADLAALRAEGII